MLDKAELKMLQDKAFEIRCKTIREIAGFGSGHIGGSMSIVEMLVYLYYKEMNIDPANPSFKERDRFVCSKGHAGPAVYATLQSKGYFDEELLSTLNKGGTLLPSHVDMTKTPGVDFTAGSLGQGFSAAVGIALGQKIQGINARTFAVVGDGESQEGQVWEAAETAGAWKLNNFIAFMDNNGQQLDGYTKDIIPMINLKERWESFGFFAIEIKGNDFEALDEAITLAKTEKERPTMIIMNTQKSYGYIPGEGVKGNHSLPISAEKAEEAIEMLKKREGR